MSRQKLEDKNYSRSKITWNKKMEKQNKSSKPLM